MSDMAFVNTSTGYICGGLGLLWRTDDGAVTWNDISVAADHSIRTLQFLDAQHGFGLGDGLLMRTVNGGSSWTDLSTEPFGAPISVRFASGTEGWVLTTDQEVIHTMNAGDTWDLRSTEDIASRLFGFADGASGFVQRFPSTLERSTDGGQTWETSLTNFGDPAIRAATFIGAQYGWAALEGPVLFQTTDGGTSWHPKGSAMQYTSAISFADTLHGWMVSSVGDIMHTNNGGAYWLAQVLPVTDDFVSVVATSTEECHLLGANGVVLRTTDHGATWHRYGTGHPENLNDVQATGGGNAWACGSFLGSTLLRTIDDGDTWSEVNTGTSNGLATLSFVGNVEGWVAGRSATVLHTADGGASWTPQTSVSPYYDIADIQFVDAQHGWVASYGQEAARTNDGGNTWEYMDVSNASETFTALHFTGTQNGWLVANSGKVFNTEDGGIAWNVKGNWPDTTLNDVFFLTPQEGWIAAYQTIRHTTDGGLSWNELASPPSWRPKIRFTDPLNGWLIANGSPNSLHRTTDGGQTWTDEAVPTDKYLTALTIAPEGDLWVVGRGGAILHGAALPLTTPAVRPDEAFSLSPNPCDGSGFTIQCGAQDGPMTIDILDTQGRSIDHFSATPNAGRIDYRASRSLASGAYMVRCISSKGTGTQRSIVR